MTTEDIEIGECRQKRSRLRAQVWSFLQTWNGTVVPLLLTIALISCGMLVLSNAVGWNWVAPSILYPPMLYTFMGLAVLFAFGSVIQYCCRQKEPRFIQCFDFDNTSVGNNVTLSTFLNDHGGAVTGADAWLSSSSYPAFHKSSMAPIRDQPFPQKTSIGSERANLQASSLTRRNAVLRRSEQHTRAQSKTNPAYSRGIAGPPMVSVQMGDTTSEVPTTSGIPNAKGSDQIITVSSAFTKPSISPPSLTRPGRAFLRVQTTDLPSLNTENFEEGKNSAFVLPESLQVAQNPIMSNPMAKIRPFDIKRKPMAH